jgi:methyl-accepting chemotaxis protein
MSVAKVATPNKQNYRPNLQGKTHTDVDFAIRNLFDGVADHDAAINQVNSQVGTINSTIPTLATKANPTFSGTVTQANPPVITAATTQTAAPSAGSADALPATPSGYMQMTVNGKTVHLAFY